MADAVGKPSPRWGIAFAALLIGGLLGYCIGNRPKPPNGPPVASLCLTPSHKILDIAANNVSTCPDGAAISKKNGDEVIWRAPKDSYVWIGFEDPNAFPDLGESGRIVESNKPNPSITPPVTKKYFYKVMGTRTPTPKATPTEMNGRIIIHK